MPTPGITSGFTFRAPPEGGSGPRADVEKSAQIFGVELKRGLWWAGKDYCSPMNNTKSNFRFSETVIAMRRYDTP